MKRHPILMHWAIQSMAGLIALTVLFVARRVAGRQPSANLIQAQIDAGEFAPALAEARSADNASQRDVLLAQIARGQERAGIGSAALATAADIESDVTRGAVLKELQSQPIGAVARGGQQVDFDTLISLIKSTVSPTTWDDVGGPGAIQGFAGGVYVDAAGVMHAALRTEQTGSLASLRSSSIQTAENANPRHHSSLRKVSLNRLERQVQLRLAAGQPISEEMQLLAGLQRVKYVMVYPEEHDLVLVGPAGDWTTTADGRSVSRENGHPVVHLDDLVVILRHTLNDEDARFGCSITPTQKGLAQIKQFAAESAEKPLKPGQRDAWLEQLRSQLGTQIIDVYGIDPRTRAGRVMVEADYRMKLVGLGLEEGVLGVPSYLESITLSKNEAPPPMDVLRWWFTLNYGAIHATQERDAFELKGQGVQVLSENELLTALGERVHTGNSNELNEQFAHNFTEQFALLAAKYPVYAELQNLFDLALVSALVKEEDLPAKIQWHATCFRDPQQYRPELSAAPKTVDTVIAHRVINRTQVLAAVSGGVKVDASKLVEHAAIQAEANGALTAARHSGKPERLSKDAWWWD